MNKALRMIDWWLCRILLNATADKRAREKLMASRRKICGKTLTCDSALKRAKQELDEWRAIEGSHIQWCPEYSRFLGLVRALELESIKNKTEWNKFRRKLLRRRERGCPHSDHILDLGFYYGAYCK